MAENRKTSVDTGKKGGRSIFRAKSLERVSSPEELNDYIRVTTPSVQIVLLAIVILLVGILAWCVFGTVTIHHEDGSTENVHPITFIIN